MVILYLALHLQPRVLVRVFQGFSEVFSDTVRHWLGVLLFQEGQFE